MKRSISTLSLVLAGAVLLGACGGAGGDADTTLADTTAVQGFDTVQTPTQVPVTDSVVTTKEVDVSKDTIEGQARDTTTRRP